MKNGNYRKVKDLPSAKAGIISVNSDNLINEAITIMLTNNFSQLPVMSGKRKVLGFISWKTIALKRHFSNQVQLVKNCMDSNHTVISENDKLLDCVKKVLKEEFVLVKDSKEIITGIITLFDVTNEFNIIAEPFLLLEEIEEHLRDLISKKLPKDLNILLNGREYSHIINTVEDLNFGDYVLILGKEENWKEIKLPLTRFEIIQQLKLVNQIRNKVMHFRHNSINIDELELLQRFAKFLRTIFRLAQID